MSLPNIPNITPNISLTREDSIMLLLSSIAMEEMALSHIINAEAEKLQYVLGTLNDQPSGNYTLEDIMKVNKSAYRMMNSVTLKEILLQVKLSNVMDLLCQYESSGDETDEDTYE